MAKLPDGVSASFSFGKRGELECVGGPIDGELRGRDRGGGQYPAAIVCANWSGEYRLTDDHRGRHYRWMPYAEP